jgi:hypothetical protein
MKRDMDLVRKILLQIEEHPHGFAPNYLAIEDYTQEQIGFHVLLMGEAGHRAQLRAGQGRQRAIRVHDGSVRQVAERDRLFWQHFLSSFPDTLSPENGEWEDTSLRCIAQGPM